MIPRAGAPAAELASAAAAAAAAAEAAEAVAAAAAVVAAAAAAAKEPSRASIRAKGLRADAHRRALRKLSRALGARARRVIRDDAEESARRANDALAQLGDSCVFVCVCVRVRCGVSRCGQHRHVIPHAGARVSSRVWLWLP